MYPASFHGLGRGLDFLLPSFLVSRQEKKVEARRIRPTEYHFNDDECAKRDTFLEYKDLITRKRVTFLGHSFHRWNVCGAYAIRPYNVTRKRIDFSRSHVGAYCIRPTGRHPKDGECAKRVTFLISIMYPAIFPGLGRGLDFLLPSFFVSRQEKKVEARRIRPTEYHFNDDGCQKRDTFSGYKDLITRKRITFLGHLFHKWNVCGAYAIRPYRVTRKRVDFFKIQCRGVLHTPYQTPSQGWWMRKTRQFFRL